MAFFRGLLLGLGVLAFLVILAAGIAAAYRAVAKKGMPDQALWIGPVPAVE